MDVVGYSPHIINEQPLKILPTEMLFFIKISSYVHVYTVQIYTCITMQYIQYLDEGFLGESLVNLRSVGDVLGSVGIVQCGQGLLQIAGGWADCGNDGRLGPPTQRVLQNPGQLTLPIYM